MGHFYTPAGEPCYQVLYADPRKGMRDTTLGDAKKLGLYKSVTTVLDLPVKPALIRWKLEQIRLAITTADLQPADGSKWWWSEVIKESEKIGKESAARGAVLHDLLEGYYKSDGIINTDKDNFEFINPVVEFMHERFPGVQWISEESFSSRQYRFGGKVDLYSPQGIVLDFKTKATSDIKKMIAYDQHGMQTAAYAVGLAENNKIRTCDNLMSNLHIASCVQRYNLFISTEQPGLLNLTESVDFERDWGMFQALNTYWNLCNKYTGD